jgi:hypothetical protein
MEFTHSILGCKAIQKLKSVAVALTLLISVFLLSQRKKSQEATKIRVINKGICICDTSNYHWSDWNIKE